MEKVKPGYKQTEVGEIPNDWNLSNILENSTMKARIGWQGLTTAEYLTSGDYYLVTGTDIYQGRVNWDCCFYVDIFRYNQDRNIQLKNNDILITKDGTIGKVAFVDNLIRPATLNSGVFVIRPRNNDYIPLFLYYVFNSNYFHSFLDKLVAGSTINHLYQKDFVTFKFPLPRRKEQEAIASALSDIDSLIDSSIKLLNKKRLIKEGAMQQLLSPKEGWAEKTLGDICDVRGGGTPSTNIYEYWNGDINWFTPTEVGYSKYLYNSIRKISLKGLKNSSAKILPIGSLLLTTRAGIGDIGILQTEACTNQGFQSLIVRKGFSNEYIYYLLLTLKKTLLQNASGSTFLEISPNKLKQIVVYMPDYSVQASIAAILSDIDNEIEILEQYLSKYKEIKDGMMQQLLTGQIRLV